MRHVWGTICLIMLVAGSCLYNISCKQRAIDNARAEPQNAAAAPYKIKTNFEGLIGFVPIGSVANPQGMWALLANASDPSKCSPNCGPRHLPALRFHRKYLQPEGKPDAGEGFVVIALDKDEITMSGGCSDSFLITSGRDDIVNMGNVAPDNAKVCSGCTGPLAGVDGNKVIGRMKIDQGDLMFDRPIKDTGGELSWCFVPLKADKTCPAIQGSKVFMKRILQHAMSEIDCTGVSLSISLKKFVQPDNQVDFTLYPRAGEIKIDIINLLGKELADPDPPPASNTSQIHHFKYFYALSENPPTSNPRFPRAAKNPDKGGRPYCTLSEFMQE